MDQRVLAWGRGIVCMLMLAGLSACNRDDTSTSATGAAASHGPSIADKRPPRTPPSIPTPPAPTPEPDPDPTDVNQPPQISGVPPSSVVVGQTYSFQPSAVDADGDNLTFSISGKPNWAAFNSATGRLSGTPGAGDVGSHEGISIRVSDGAVTQSLPQFAVAVVQNANGSATLAWQPPTQNTDGTPLTNLDGYKIHYGNAPGNYSNTITIQNAGITRYVVENLAPGTYYFSVTALSTSGAESDRSPEASKTIG